MSDQPTVEITLPSGLSGRIRDVTLGDIKVLNEGARSKKTDPLAAFLRGIWTDTTDPGPYSWPGQRVIDSAGSVDWSQAMQGDTAALVLDARAATFGPEVHFEPTCPHCRNSFAWVVSIDDLRRNGLSEEATKRVSEEGTDAQFEIELPRSGVNVRWKILTRADQFRVDVAIDGDRTKVDIFGLMARLPYIAGMDSPGKRRKFISSMSLVDVETLREEYERHDIELQDTVEIECPRCGARSEVAFPFGRDFFSLRSARKPKNAPSEFEG